MCKKRTIQNVFTHPNDLKMFCLTVQQLKFACKFISIVFVKLPVVAWVKSSTATKWLNNTVDTQQYRKCIHLSPFK